MAMFFAGIVVSVVLVTTLLAMEPGTAPVLAMRKPTFRATLRRIPGILPRDRYPAFFRSVLDILLQTPVHPVMPTVQVIAYPL